jgi:hypothetical protein
MKSWIHTFPLLFGIVWSAILPTDAQVNVVQEHNNLSRDGLYIDPAFTTPNHALQPAAGRGDVSVHVERCGW